jgi:hypothetical protein
MQELIAWLNHPDYKIGVELFLKHSRNKRLNDLFRYEAESPYKKARLLKEINLLISKHQEKPPVEYDTATHTSITVGWPPKPITDVVLAALYDQWKPMYDEMLNLQARIYDVALQATNGNDLKMLESCQMAHRICDLDDACDAIYAKRDHYLQNGSLPTEAPKREIVGDPVKWALELQNLLRYERRYKNILQKEPGHRLSDKRAQTLQQCQEDIAWYKSLLKIDHEG